MMARLALRLTLIATLYKAGLICLFPFAMSNAADGMVAFTTNADMSIGFGIPMKAFARGPASAKRASKSAHK